MSSEAPSKAVPAQLSFLAIYNPSLGTTDETFRDQVVFYWSRAARARRKDAGQHGEEAEHEQLQREEENEKLRQIGLAQGMVDFARSFSDGEAMDSVETEKSRIVLREVEEGWWVLASIDLTRIPGAPSPAGKSASGAHAEQQLAVEYSAREVSPPMLLIGQVLRAHRIFCLHHGPSLTDLYAKLQRAKFSGALERYWTRFANNWDVLLHGNPAVEIYHGIKLSAGGELGVGVGEEEWGSGEREVFEHFADQTEGLVDMVVSRFGEPSPEQLRAKSPTHEKRAKTVVAEEPEPWMGMGVSAGPADGVVFSGIGAVSRLSLCNIADWAQQIFTYGEQAYGVKDSPGSERRKRRKKEHPNGHPKAASRGRPGRKASTREYPTIPPPILSAVEQSLDRASAAAEAEQTAELERGRQQEAERSRSPGAEDGWTKYLTLGYGSAWGPGSSKRPQVPREPSGTPAASNAQRREAPAAEPEPEPERLMQFLDPEPEGRRLEDRITAQVNAENTGHFIVGLRGGLDDELEDDDPPSEAESAIGGSEWNSRTLIRTLHVELTRPSPPARSYINEPDTLEKVAQDGKPSYTRLRVIVYVHRPFIYTFLFHPRTDSLAMPSFYRNLHTFFGPLHRPLSNSTDPTRVAARIAAASSHSLTTMPAPKPASSKDVEQQPIFDLIFDPNSMTLHTSIPNIPQPGTLGAEGLALSGTGPPWTRVEALNVHSQILTTVAATHQADAAGELERTAKTSRGWWVVWMRVNATYAASNSGISTIEGGGAESSSLQPVTSSASSVTLLSGEAHMPAPPVPEESLEPAPKMPASHREAILIRQARDVTSSSGSKSGARSTSGMWTLGLGGGTSSLRTGGSQAGWGPARLAEGIGVDARRYVEGLLSLNR
ncbi:hypothetical protein NA57DRAFT_74137 [Rhizodiscina lignyota]|uniref:CCZ1/INTU/HSP4 first Longin domain-containing protein n=1 Tax=Rhizodiscina lignyota TaxID=1504668 RepID=A0A9P4ILX5_9PEZI|nr:hypothetical protein NA57DRAFT_74137 [Rhizodiscina lignyota]